MEQQVSLASAKAAYDRLRAAVTLLTPERFLALDDAELKRIRLFHQFDVVLGLASTSVCS